MTQAVQATPSASPFVRSSHSFAGVDIQAMFGNIRIGTIQAVSYAITREKAPIYTMGSADPRAFSRGKRAIAGSLVFIMFDRHPLLEYMQNLKFVADADEIRYVNVPGTADGAFSSASFTGPSAPGASGVTDTIAGSRSSIAEEVADQQVVSPWYVDQIPPFDITVVAGNEYGANAKMGIYNVEITDEGHGFSVDDIQLGHQMKWIGRYVLPWTYVTSVADSPILRSASSSDSNTGQ